MRQSEKKGTRQISSRMHLIAILMLVAARAMAQEQASGAAPQPSPRRIVISVADRKLALIEDGQVVQIYPVAVGAKVSASPTGEFQIINRLENPTYYHPGKVIGPGKDNPLGTRWMGLNRKGYGIHGTNEPRSIGKAASHGCIRMAKKDLEQLFQLVRVGDVVEIIGGRDEAVARIFGEPAQPTVMASADTAIAGQN